MLGTVLGAGEKPEGEPSHRGSHSRGRGSQTPVQRGLGVPDLGWQCCGAESAGAACQEDQEEVREGQEVVLCLALKDKKDFTGERWGGSSKLSQSVSLWVRVQEGSSPGAPQATLATSGVPGLSSIDPSTRH